MIFKGLLVSILREGFPVAHCPSHSGKKTFDGYFGFPKIKDRQGIQKLDLQGSTPSMKDMEFGLPTSPSHFHPTASEA